MLQNTFDFGDDTVIQADTVYQQAETGPGPLVRSFHGFIQRRETPSSAWQFSVLDFDEAACTGKNGFCRVERADGSSCSVPINTLDEITIRGKQYGRAFWDH